MAGICCAASAVLAVGVAVLSAALALVVRVRVGSAVGTDVGVTVGTNVGVEVEVEVSGGFTVERKADIGAAERASVGTPVGTSVGAWVGISTVAVASGMGDARLAPLSRPANASSPHAIKAKKSAARCPTGPNHLSLTLIAEDRDERRIEFPERLKRGKVPT